MDQYVRIRNVGKGNMGQCLLVRNLNDNQQYVMKLIDLSKMNKKEKTASLNEAKVLSSLEHPNVINYVDSFLSRKTEHLCIVMEYAEGGDLATRIKLQRGKPFSEEQILDWFIQICLAVKYCHQKRVMHRDIKTQNIFLTSSGVIKVGDFGISRVLQNTYDCAHTFVGTPYYLSPELVQERPYNTMSDIWALGVVLYELMSLRHPFNATDMKGLMYKILRVIYDPPPNLYTPDLRGLIPRLLVKDPSRRLTAQEILDSTVIRRRLESILSGMVQTNLPVSYVISLSKMAAAEIDEVGSENPSSSSNTDNSESDDGEDSRPAPRVIRPPVESKTDWPKRQVIPNDPHKLQPIPAKPTLVPLQPKPARIEEPPRLPSIPNKPAVMAGQAIEAFPNKPSYYRAPPSYPFHNPTKPPVDPDVPYYEARQLDKIRNPPPKVLMHPVWR